MVRDRLRRTVQQQGPDRLAATGNWIVEDGVITLRPREGEEGWQRYDACLTTKKTYRSFVLEVEFTFESEGDSGVILRVGDLEDHVSSELEAQIRDTHHLEKPGNHDCGGIIRATAPFTNAVRPAGQWNRYQTSWSTPTSSPSSTASSSRPSTSPGPP